MIINKKLFKQINKTIFIEYGFVFFKKNYYLLLPNIVIRLQYMSYPVDKGEILSYDIIIKGLVKMKSDELVEVEQVFDDLSEIPVQMPALKDIEFNVCKDKKISVIVLDKIKESFWKEQFIKEIHNIFDPFIADDLG